MPYYIVTHRSIVQAEDETQAAEIAAGKMISATSLAFEVDCEGERPKRITVSGRPASATQQAGSPPASSSAHDGEQLGAVQGLETAASGRDDHEPRRSDSRGGPISAGSAVVCAVGFACLLLSAFLRFG